MTPAQIREALFRTERVLTSIRNWHQNQRRRHTATEDQLEANEIALAEVKAQADTYRAALRSGKGTPP